VNPTTPFETADIAKSGVKTIGAREFTTGIQEKPAG